MTATINQQIAFVRDQIANMKVKLPIAVQEGRMSAEYAARKLETAKATLNTLTQLRAITRGDEVQHG